ncbi:hypothetical protein IVA80_08855 [Bradyrhizobium sp. 139]|uniref:hypothetical protein n=1 Tax=Bradyrhizobium sp. 139 TaxID=2782616 RepID=UPI001FFB0D9C|nr:hypothetical protein [Bradyrhizobium sp. 139]MCK1740987.1 hypothetical protein [Bradyrhizobium sp. 139]
MISAAAGSRPFRLWRSFTVATECISSLKAATAATIAARARRLRMDPNQRYCIAFSDFPGRKQHDRL